MAFTQRCWALVVQSAFVRQPGVVLIDALQSHIMLAESIRQKGSVESMLLHCALPTACDVAPMGHGVRQTPERHARPVAQGVAGQKAAGCQLGWQNMSLLVAQYALWCAPPAQVLPLAWQSLRQRPFTQCSPLGHIALVSQSTVDSQKCEVVLQVSPATQSESCWQMPVHCALTHAVPAGQS